RDLGRTPAPARTRARPLRDQAALLPTLRGGARVRVRAARTPTRPDRPRRSRGVPGVQLDPRAADDLPGGPQAAGRTPPDLGERASWGRAIRATGGGPC